MTFEEFVTEWRLNAREIGSEVSQEAIDIAAEAWNMATKAERERCVKACYAEAVTAFAEGADERGESACMCIALIRDPSKSPQKGIPQ